MPSRRKRKRERRKAEATAQRPKVRGDWGECAPLSRGELLLVRHAIRERWPVPPEVRQAIVDGVMRKFNEPMTTNREHSAIAWCVLTMTGDNLRRCVEFQLSGCPAPVS